MRFDIGTKRYCSVAKYIAKLGLYVHKYVEGFSKANRLPGSDSKTAEVSKLISLQYV